MVCSPGTATRRIGRVSPARRTSNGPVAASECRTAVEQRVVFRNGGQHGATYLADVGTSQPGTAVQLLDVVVFDLEAQAARVDAAVNERVEHESVVRAG